MFIFLSACVCVCLFSQPCYHPSAKSEEKYTHTHTRNKGERITPNDIDNKIYEPFPNDIVTSVLCIHEQRHSIRGFHRILILFPLCANKRQQKDRLRKNGNALFSWNSVKIKTKWNWTETTNVSLHWMGYCTILSEKLLCVFKLFSNYICFIMRLPFCDCKLELCLFRPFVCLVSTGQESFLNISVYCLYSD